MKIASIIVIIVLVLALAYAWYNYHAKHRHHYSEEQLRKAVADTFAESNGAEMPKEKFVNRLKVHLSCSHKEALYLAGVAQKDGLIRREGHNYLFAG